MKTIDLKLLIRNLCKFDDIQINEYYRMDGVF